MLRYTAAQLARTDLEDALRNALLESFAIHARALAHFFFPDRPHVSDVLASDFFSSEQRWANIAGQRHELLGAGSETRSIRFRANKEIAHLTYDRLAVLPAEKAWDISQILATLEALITKFADSADKSRLVPRVQQEPAPTFRPPRSSATATNATVLCNSMTLDNAISVDSQDRVP